MAPIATVHRLTKRYGDFVALDDISFSLETDTIHGLLGRNGAGKTTVMRILAGQDFPTSGQVEIFGKTPHENEAVLPAICLVQESQRYPEHLNVEQVLRAAALRFPLWDSDFAESLRRDFDLPPRCAVKRLSRGMRSAVGAIVGLASRAPLTIFDEPYLGLDAVARQLFYDRLLADYAEHPRTIVLSTHLIDEVSDLLERVLVIERGRIVIDGAADELRESVVSVAGPASAVDEFIEGRTTLKREQLAGAARVTVVDEMGDERRAAARALGLTLEPVGLQELVVAATTAGKPAVKTNRQARTKEAVR